MDTLNSLSTIWRIIDAWRTIFGPYSQIAPIWPVPHSAIRNPQSAIRIPFTQPLPRPASRTRSAPRSDCAASPGPAP